MISDVNMWFNTTMKPHSVNMKNNFIEGYYTQHTIIVDLINKLFDDEHIAGKTETIDSTNKQSIELSFNQYPKLMAEWEEHILTPALSGYTNKYPWSLDVSPFHAHVEGTNIQHYEPSTKGYYRWHAERASRDSGHRHLVFMTYLNDVTDGGETEFWHQDVSIKPEKGLTLIFPSDWTFTHRGLASPSQHKRFITGWFSYQKEED